MGIKIMGITKMKKRLATIALIALVAPFSVHATLMEITVSGRIYSSYDQDGTVFGYGAGQDTILGRMGKITFRYDSANAPSNSSGRSDTAIYKLSGASWIESQAWVDEVEVPNFW